MKGTTELQEAVSDADMVIEAIVENLDIKKDVWEKIGEFAPEHTIFGSNTSSLPITEMATASGRPSKFLGTHFFNPPVKLKLIEFIKAYETSEETLTIAKQFGKSMEMETVVADETPGFIVNRLLLPMLNEAYFALQEGIALLVYNLCELKMRDALKKSDQTFQDPSLGPIENPTIRRVFQTFMGIHIHYTTWKGELARENTLNIKS